MPIKQHHIDNKIKSLIQKMNLKSSRILCLTEEKDSDPMWAYYAQDHSGCNLCFSTNNREDSEFKYARKVSYIDGNPPVGNALDMLMYDIPDKIAETSVDAVFFTKNKNWEHEKEWRLLYFDNKTPHENYIFNKFDPTDLYSITFGYKSDEIFIADTLELINNNFPKTLVFKSVKQAGTNQLIEIN